MLWILIVVTCFEVSTLADAQSERTTSLDEDANNNEPDHPVPMESIQGVAGQRAILPCNIQPREPNDAVTMVLWFKKDSGDPLYRLYYRMVKSIDMDRNKHYISKDTKRILGEIK
ncbi:hypothetical protein HZH66_009583 [Vespula vulgaris]|uniref:Uncharacterized protein n=1 Tax=Vespula vulgaris TaxID=7454 RepID=A0A834JM36_VESVU|nr:hypothetical protein HZH66_009583 [Vespula vulgaris]